MVYQEVHRDGVAGFEEAVCFVGLSVQEWWRVYHSFCVSGTVVIFFCPFSCLLEVVLRVDTFEDIL